MARGVPGELVAYLVVGAGLRARTRLSKGRLGRGELARESDLERETLYRVTRGGSGKHVYLLSLPADGGIDGSCF